MTEIHGFSACLQLEQIFDEFESEWRSGTRPRLELFLTRALVRDRDTVQPDHDAVLKELLCIELEQRIQRDDVPEYSDYIKRFPDKNALIDLAFREATANLDNWRPPRVTRFQTIDRLGQGGQGEVWLARDSQIDRHVALKVVKPSRKASRPTLAKFRREAEVSAKLEHPNVVPVYDITQELTASGQPDPESPCFVMRVYGDPRLHAAIEAFQAKPRSKEDRLLLRALQRFEKDRSGGNRTGLLQELDRFRFDDQQAHDQLLKSSAHAILEHDSEAGSLAKAIAKFHEHEWSGSELRKLLSRFQRVCEAVAYAHDRGIIHRDLKPENVMLGEFGETLVADWGLAKIVAGTTESTVEVPHSKLHIKADSEHAQTLHGGIVGTPSYMSPEQAEGRSGAIGPATDIYSLGAMLYCILTGQAPIGAKARKSDDAVGEPTRLSTKEILARVRTGDFLAPHQVEPRTPKPLAAIILKAMSLHPDHRYTTAVELADDIQRWLNDEPVSVWREPIAVRTRRWVKGHQTAVTAVAVMILAGMLTLSVMLVVVHHEKVKTADALELAETNATTATEQAQLALNTLRSVIFDLQRSLIDVPGGATVRNRLLATVMPQMDKVATEFASRSAVERTTMIAIGDMADTILQLGHNDETSLTPAGTVLSLTPEMTAVNIAERLYRRALEMSQELAASDPESREAQRDLSVSFEKIGDISLRLGRADEAFGGFQESLRIRRMLAADDTNDVTARIDLSVSHDKIGNALLQLGRTSDVLTHFQQGLEIRLALAKTSPNDSRVKRDLAISYERLGSTLLQIGQTDEALAKYNDGFIIRSALARENPDDIRAQRDLSVSSKDLGEVLMRLGRTDDALAKHEDGLKIRRMIAEADPANVEKQRDLSVSLAGTGSILLKLRRFDQSIAMCEEGLSIKRSLATADPGDKQKQRDLLVGLEKLGFVCLTLERTREANQLFEEAINIGRTLAEANPEDVRAQRDLSILYERRGETRLKSDNAFEALKDFEEELSIRRMLAAKDSASAENQRDLNVALYNVGDALMQLGRTDEALVRFEEGIVIRRDLATADPGNAVKQRDLSVGFNRLGDAMIKLDRIEDALTLYQDALSVIRPLAKAAPNDMRIKQDLLFTCNRVADVLLQLDRVDEWNVLLKENPSASPDLLTFRMIHFAKLENVAGVAQIGTQLRELQPQTENTLYNAACAFSVCAGLCVKDKLQPSDTELAEQKKYLDLSISCLKEAIAAGFDDYGNMRQDPDLTSLAGLPEFEALFPK